MDRKKFLLASTVTAFSISTFGKIIKKNESEFAGDCDTTNDILGPYYRPDAPVRSDLTYDGLKGNKIILKGRIMKADCITMLKNALVEIWQCDPDGNYDNDTKEFRLRARWFTNERGEYSFTTAFPGKYLNGELYRPAHIHFRISEPTCEELISQIYFKGDPHITKDPWASDPKAKMRILDVVPEDVKGNFTVRFDVYLKDKA
jgi:catechol 1,2-dioxygenase